MNSYTIQLHSRRCTILAPTPRKALWLAIQKRAIPNGAWGWLKDAKNEGYYGPLSIIKNHAPQLLLPLTFTQD